MQYLLFTGPNGYTSIYGPLTTEQTDDLIAQFGLTVGSYAVVTDISGLPAGWQNYPKGVTFTSPSTVNFDFTLAQLEAKEKSALTFQEQSNNALTLVPQFILSAQMALPEVDRLPVVNETVSTMNAIATDMQATFDLIDAATSLTELEAINNPPAISGSILLDRDSLLLDNSVFVTLTGAPEAEMYLFIPATATTLPYDALIDGFSSGGLDVFVSGNYVVQLKFAGTTVGTFDLVTTVPTEYSFAYVPPTTI